MASTDPRGNQEIEIEDNSHRIGFQIAQATCKMLYKPDFNAEQERIAAEPITCVTLDSYLVDHLLSENECPGHDWGLSSDDESKTDEEEDPVRTPTNPPNTAPGSDVDAEGDSDSAMSFAPPPLPPPGSKRLPGNTPINPCDNLSRKPPRKPTATSKTPRTPGDPSSKVKKTPRKESVKVRPPERRYTQPKSQPYTPAARLKTPKVVTPKDGFLTGARALAEIKYLQQTNDTGMILAWAPFVRLVKTATEFVAKNLNIQHDIRWRKEALDALRHSAEEHILSNLSAGFMAAIHAGQNTLMQKDTRVAWDISHQLRSERTLIDHQFKGNYEAAVRFGFRGINDSPSEAPQKK